jgi:NitT/TauT family transport system ATP-binding protein
MLVASNLHLVSAPSVGEGRQATPAVELNGVSVDYGGSVLAVADIGLTLGEGEFLSIVGPSGCGKSTLLKIISGLERPSRGSARVRGQAINQVPAECGFMFQRDALLPWATVRENIAIGVECGKAQRRSNSVGIEELLSLVGLSGFGDFYPRALSGGMRQRAALGRILAYAPDIYLMDEPFGALDAQTKLLMGQELLNIWARFGKAVVFVTHDIEEAVSLSERVIVMSGIQDRSPPPKTAARSAQASAVPPLRGCDLERHYVGAGSAPRHFFIAKHRCDVDDQ